MNSVAALLCRAKGFLRMGEGKRALEAVADATLTAELTRQRIPFLDHLGLPIADELTRLSSVAPPPALPPPPQPDPVVEALNLPALSSMLPPAAAAPPPVAKAPPPVAPAPPVTKAPAPVAKSPAPVAAARPPVPTPQEVKTAATLEREGREATSRGDFQEAVALFDQSIELDPTVARAYNARGYALMRMQNFDRAVEDFTEAIQLQPDYANAYQNRAAANRKLGNRTAASDDARSAQQFLDTR